MLQEIEKKYKVEPLTVLALSIDGKETQPKIPEYLNKNHLNSHVLLAGEDKIQGYEFEPASSLFVVDRKGMLAGTPGEFYFRLEKELNRRLPGLLAAQPAPGPLLWTMRKAPPGFGELWHTPVDVPISSIAMAPGSGDRPPEIGILDEAHHFKRYSSRGDLLSDVALEDSKAQELRAVDLDGDGKVEWIVGKEKGFEILDSSGKSYWKYSGSNWDEWFYVGGSVDLDGDGHKEIIVRSGDEITALKNVPKLVWKNDRLHDVKRLSVDPRGRIWVQTGATVRRLNADGSLSTQSFQAPGSTVFLGEGQGSGSSHVRFFGSPYNDRADLLHDLDGDGKSDIIIPNNGGVIAYAQDGTTLLDLFIADNQVDPPIALANLDGKPGDELLVYLPNYGLTAFGMSQNSARQGN